MIEHGRLTARCLASAAKQTLFQGRG